MRGLFVFVSMSLAAASMAENYSYVQWYDMPLDGIQTYGALFIPHGDHTIGWFTATYTGEVNHAQTPEGGSYFAYDAHRGPAVQNAPLNGDLIGIVGGAGTVHHFECGVGSRRFAMPVVSMGQSGLPISYELGIPFAIASQGNGAFGFGSLSQPVSGRLVGEEGHGTLIFHPGLSAVDWTVPEGEYWHGFTFGINIGDYRPVHLLVETGDYIPAGPMSSLGGFTIDIFETANPTNRETWTSVLTHTNRVPLFTQLAPGIYSVSVKGPRWLRRTFADAIEITSDGGRLDTPFQLINGDADQDNEVSIGDYAILSGGYGLSYGDAGWYDYDNADFNVDLTIDIADYAIISANYGQIGDD